MYDILKQNFINPTPEFTVLPFWFLNDDIDDAELVRQIDGFHARGVDGFVLHPRIGMPRSIPYMSERFLDIAEVCVKRAAENGMYVILYDEASYPSGSACGQVVAANPSFAARKLRRVKLDGGETSGDPAPDSGGNIANGYAVGEGEFVIAQAGGYAFVEGFTRGKIRGLHPDQDDGMPGAPPAGDLLNPAAVAAFIELTHERYFKRLGKYFGKTVTAFFTDEPSLTGRGGDMRDSIPWSAEFLYDFIEAGGSVADLPELFAPDGAEAAKHAYHRAVRKRLGDSYYRQLGEWCKSHGVALTGHPSGSGETDVQRYFDIPGQDIVWRWVAPENYLASPDGVAAKCGADSARHLDRRRNMNEVMGVCGAKGNPWDFTASDMMWYLNHLFARGVNMVVPHAFYYSLRTKAQFGERPPDVGPGSVWWPYYDRVARFAKRMSWLNTNSQNSPLAAVLGGGESLPHESVRCLYEGGLDFNYLDPYLFAQADISGGEIKVGRYSYKILLVDESAGVLPETEAKIKAFERSGGKVCRVNGGDKAESGSIGSLKTANGSFEAFVRENAIIRDFLTPQSPHIRLTRLEKCGVHYILLTDEGYDGYAGTLTTDLSCACEVFDPYTGEITPANVTAAGKGGMEIAVTVKPRVPLILAFNTGASPALNPPRTAEVIGEYKIEVGSGGGLSAPVNVALKPGARCLLTAGEVRDQCRVAVNGTPAGEMLFIPWELDVTRFVREGENSFGFEVDGSSANKYGSPVPTGIWDIRLKVIV